MTSESLLPGLEPQSEPMDFVPSRAAGLARLDRFASRAGRHYAGQRNYDFGPDRRNNVSVLSPWIRHRLITETEVLTATLARHTPAAAEKFIQEVFWRTYFKGWLEQRPSVWTAYQQGRDNALLAFENDRSLAATYQDAVAGHTGIECFDQWAKELTATGYLHNHARMWFASIWIFTLRLPWELGADFFLRHLLDGDPASNTLSWRWVAGLHTKGKAYQARAANIATYTANRFQPGSQLSSTALPLREDVEHARKPIPRADQMPPEDFLLLVTEEDGCFETILPHPPVSVLGLLATKARSPLPIGSDAKRFAYGAVADGISRAGAAGDQPLDTLKWAEAIISAAQKAHTKHVVTAFAPVGPVATQLASASVALREAGIALHQVRRPYDDLAWPHATRGFFALKQKIPQFLTSLGLRG